MKKLILACLLLTTPAYGQTVYFDYADDLIPGTLARPDVIDANFLAIETAFANVTDDFFVLLWQGDWVTGKEYLVNAFVTESDILYVCVVKHTSGVFATDLAAGNWEVVLSNTIGDNAVTNAKLRDSAALSVIGRAQNSLGDPGDIAASVDDTVLRRTGGTLNFGLLTSDMFGGAVVTTGAIANDAVDGGKLRDSAALSVMGRNINSIGNPGDIIAGGNDQLLRRTGDTLSFGTLTSGMFPAGVVPDSALSSNVPRLDQANTFTNSPLSLSDVAAQIVLEDTDGGVDEKITRITNNNGGLFVQSLTDAGIFQANLLSASRAGATWSTFDIVAGSITANGEEVATITSGSFSLTFPTGCSTPPTVDVFYTKVGPVVVWNMEEMSCVSDGTDDLISNLGSPEVPSLLRPSGAAGEVVVTVAVLNDGDGAFGCMRIAPQGHVELAVVQGNSGAGAVGACTHDGFLTSGTKGFEHTTLTYSVN